MVTVEQCEMWIDRANVELDRIDQMAASPERDAALAKVCAWLDTEWPRIPEDVRRKALANVNGRPSRMPVKAA